MVSVASALHELLPPAPSHDESDAAVRTTQLSVSFGGIKALDGVDATVPHREVSAIVGPNGAGKTTFLNSVSGLLQSGVTTGTIELCGRRVEEMRAVKIASLGLGRSFQHPPLLEDETVVENILIGAHRLLPYGVLGQIITPWRAHKFERAESERARALLDFVGLADAADDKASGLSYGSRKMVDILRAVFTGPRVLALDEPTSGLDSNEKARVVELITAISAMNRMSVLLVEHHMDIVRACASNVLGMAAGDVVVAGSPDDVLNSPIYREALVGGHNSRGASAMQEDI